MAVQKVALVKSIGIVIGMLIILGFFGWLCVITDGVAFAVLFCLVILAWVTFLVYDAMTGGW